MSHSERDQEVLSFFSTFLSSPQPRNAPRPAGRGHLRSFLQHLSRRPPRGAASARGGAGRRGLQVAARRPGALARPACPALSSHPGRRPRPPPSRRSPSPSLSLSRMFSFLEERN